jgi:3-deoxy-D-manno-octulosonate 8-phosphate phosphatase (KDO 8-P phosphatase)
MNTPLKSPAGFVDACKKIRMLLFDCDGVLTDGRIVLGNNGTELKFFSTCDGIGMNLWKKGGFSCGVISGRSSEALSQRARELKFDELHQGSMSKGEVLADIMQRRGLEAEEIAYIGDDLNDLPVGTKVGLFFVPANHSLAIRPYADYILSTSGGHGAVREAIDLILGHKGLLEQLVQSYITSA